MILKRISPGLTAAVLLLVIVLGAWMWYLKPADALKWAIVIFMLPGAWTALEFFKRTGGRSWGTGTDRFQILHALVLAGLILSVSLSMGLASNYDLIEGSASERTMGVVLGVVLIIYGNSIPKMLSPLSRKGCNPSKSQSFQRFAGWTFVLAGLAYAIVWIILPLETANIIATLFCAAAVVLVAVRVVPSLMRRKRAQPPVES